MNFEGTKYDSSMTLKDVAKAVREDIKAAKKDGRIEKSTRVSIRAEYHSMGCCLHVTVNKFDGMINNPEAVRFVFENPCTPMPRGIDRLTPEALVLINTLRAIVREYNYNNSDSMTDYYDVNFSTAFNFKDFRSEETQMRLDLIAETVEEKKAQAAAATETTN